MRRSNRTLNRLLLALVGLVLLAAAALAVWPAAVRAIPTLALPSAPRLAHPDATVLWWVVGCCGAVALIAVLWAATRGGGGTRTVLSVDRVDVDVRVIRDLLAQGIERHPSVVGVEASGHVLRGRPLVALRVRARRGADLAAVTERIRLAIADVDRALGRSVPMLVRVTASGRESRVE